MKDPRHHPNHRGIFHSRTMNFTGDLAMQGGFGLDDAEEDFSDAAQEVDAAVGQAFFEVSGEGVKMSLDGFWSRHTHKPPFVLIFCIQNDNSLSLSGAEIVMEINVNDKSELMLVRNCLQEAEAMIDESKYDVALEKLYFGLNLLPKTGIIDDIHEQIIMAIVDVYYDTCAYDLLVEFYLNQVIRKDILGNGFLRLRYGEALFELNRIEEAKKQLFSAYLIDGSEIFKDENPKYLTAALDVLENEQYN